MLRAWWRVRSISGQAKSEFEVGDVLFSKRGTLGWCFARMLGREGARYRLQKLGKLPMDSEETVAYEFVALVHAGAIKLVPKFPVGAKIMFREYQDGVQVVKNGAEVLGTIAQYYCLRHEGQSELELVLVPDLEFHQSLEDE